MKVVQMAIPRDAWVAVVAQAPSDGVYDAEEWAALELGRRVGDVLLAGFAGASAPVPVDMRLVHAARVRAVRKAAGWSLHEMAALCEVTHGAVANWERGAGLSAGRRHQVVALARAHLAPDVLARVWPDAAGVSPAGGPSGGASSEEV